MPPISVRPPVAWTAIAGGLTVIIMWGVQTAWGVTVPAEVASAFTTVMGGLAGYFAPRD